MTILRDSSLRHPRPEVPLWRVLRDATIVAGCAALCALAVNALRPDGIELWATTEYEILVPCPEPMGEAEAIAPGDERVQDGMTLLVDARDPADFESWHLPTSVSVPFDWLAEQHEIEKQARELARTVARSGKREVVVYGDGGDPDSGYHWAALLSASGIKRVSYVSGGAPALRKSSSTGGPE